MSEFRRTRSRKYSVRSYGSLIKEVPSAEGTRNSKWDTLSRRGIIRFADGAALIF